MEWIEFEENEFCNLDKFFHLWIQKTVNGYHIEGTLMTGEDMVASRSFDTLEKCRNTLLLMTQKGWHVNK